MSKSALKILNTAERLFNQNSFSSVGVDLIRDQSGCSKTTMYTHYKNKAQLIQFVLIERDDRFRRDLLNYIGESKKIDAINQIIDWHLLWFQQDSFKGCLFVRAIAETAPTEQAIIDFCHAHKTWLQNLIAEQCLHLQYHQVATTIIYTLLEGLISRFLVEGFRADIALQIKQHIQQLMS